MNNQLVNREIISLALEVMKRSDEDEYQNLVNKIGDLKQQSFMYECDRHVQLIDILQESEKFCTTLIVLSLEIDWKKI